MYCGRALNGLLMAALLLLTFGGNGFGQAAPGPTEATRVERLAGLCRLWGAIKFFHPYLGYRSIDWDAALVKALPQVDAAQSPADYRAALTDMLAGLHDPNTHVVAPFPAANSPHSAAAEDLQPHVRLTSGNVAIVRLAGYHSYSANPAIVEKVMSDAVQASALVFDLRRGTGFGSQDDDDAAGVAEFFMAFLGRFVRDDVPCASLRSRMHSGWSPSSGPNSGYYSGFAVQAGDLLHGRGQKATPKPMVFLISPNMQGIHGLLSGMHAAHLATVVLEGEAIEEPGIDTYTLNLPEGVGVEMRTNEWVSPDGSVGFHPDRVISESADRSESGPGIRAALSALHEFAKSPVGRSRAASGTPVDRKDAYYVEMTYPNRAYRLLALFRLWNVIHYLYPYQALMDRPWETVLTEMIPRFEAAKDALEYGMAVAETARRIDDSHVFAMSRTLMQYLGVYGPLVRVGWVDGRTVVTSIADDAVRAGSGLNPGDEILAVDGEEVEARRDRLAALFAASTPQALRSRVHQQLLKGAQGSKVKLKVRTLDGKETTVELARTASYLYAPLPKKAITVLPEGFGYIDLRQLTVPQIGKAMETVKGTPGLIFDMRGYPNGTIWSLAPYLASKKVVVARFERLEPRSPDPDFVSTLRFNVTTEPGSQPAYRGKVVVLINEEAISQAEYTCQFLEAAAGAMFVGTPTNGTDGDVTDVGLPGGITVTFTGQGVCHGDGRQTQRIGILPDIKAEPTRAGLRAGRDEVLEAAIHYLKEKTGK